MIRNLLRFALCFSAFNASASTITVNSLNDATGCSLRNAILASNTNAAVAGCSAGNVEGTDQIQIVVSGTYSPTSALPPVTDYAVIAATLGDFVLDGSAAGATANGLQFEITGDVRGLVIQNFGGSGIVTHRCVSVRGCRIGTDAAGLTAAPNCTGVGNAGAGILVENYSCTFIGGQTVADRNVISGNQCHGVLFRNTPGFSTGGEVTGNYIGTSACGCEAIPNSGYGVALEGGADHLNLDVEIGWEQGLGTACTGGCNVIAGNTLGQIHVGGGIGRIYANVIGANATMTAGVPTAAGAQTGAGVLIDGTGEALMSGDVIVRSSDAGIRVEDPGRLLLQASRIGATVQGTIISNATGVLLRGSAPVVVETSSIVASEGAGIVIDGGSNSVIRKNNIGILGSNSPTPAGNRGGGIVMKNGANHNVIGGAGQANTIAYNTITGHGPAVSVASGGSNVISQNSIFENYGTLSSLAIDLGADGPTANDECDGDTGPNNRQNAPVITLVTPGRAAACSNCDGTRISGTLSGQANTHYRIEVFTNRSGTTPQLRGYLGSNEVMTDASCNASWFLVASTASTLSNVVATATAVIAGDTSEESAPVVGWPDQPDPEYDMNADGYTDLLWRNFSNGNNAVWQLDAAQQILSVQNLAGLPNTDYRIESSFYLPGSGNNANILWRNYVTGANAIWIMPANGAVPTAVVELPAIPNTQFYVGGTADFNGDGYTDIVWRNNDSGFVGIWLMNGTSYVSTENMGAARSPEWTIAGAADFNADGRADLLWRNVATGENTIDLLGPTYSSSADIPALPNTAYSVAAIGDYNADRNPDIVWHNTTTGAVAIWLMNGTQLASIVNLPSVPNVAIVPHGPR
jgi:hypothetical protein